MIISSLWYKLLFLVIYFVKRFNVSSIIAVVEPRRTPVHGIINLCRLYNFLKIIVLVFNNC